MAEEIKNPAAEAPEVNLGDILRVRREKLAALREAGADPFQITKYPQDTYSAEIKERFAYLEAEAETEVEVCLAGRMMTKRVMGKASFAHLRDDKGDIQIYVRRDVIGDEAYAGFKKMDIGDIIGLKGTVFKTKTGEISIHASELTLLSKSLQILPEKYHGITNTDPNCTDTNVPTVLTCVTDKYDCGEICSSIGESGHPAAYLSSADEESVKCL